MNQAMYTLFESLLFKLKYIHPKIDSLDKSYLLWLRKWKKKQWARLKITNYRSEYYFYFLDIKRNEVSFKFDTKNKEFGYIGSNYDTSDELVEKILKLSTDEASQIIDNCAKYNKHIKRYLPFYWRLGKIQRSQLWKLLPESFNPLNELNKKEVLDFENVVAHQVYANDFISKLSLNYYLKACSIAYKANIGKDDRYKAIKMNMSPVDLYRKMADGRDENLLDIDSDDPQAFRKWYHNRVGGGHPWEICRGGNATHITLGVIYEHYYGWRLYLEGASTSRLIETTRMAIALKKVPFVLHNYKQMIRKIKGTDNIGIVPWFMVSPYSRPFVKHERVYETVCLEYYPAEFKKIKENIIWSSPPSYQVVAE